MIRMARRLLTASLYCLVLATTPSQASAQTTDLDKLTAAQWRDDLHRLADQMPKVHGNLFHTMTRDQLAEAVSDLDRRLDGLNTDQVLVGFARLTALITDAHSGSIGPLEYGSRENYPLRLGWYPDGIYVRAAPPEYASAVGARLVRIGHTNIDDALRAVGAIVPHDPGNDGRLRAEGTILYLTSSRVLHGLDITPTASEASFVVARDGHEQILTLHPGANALQLMGFAPTAVPWIDAAGSMAATLRGRNAKGAYGFEYVPENHLLYVQLNTIQDRGEETLDAFFERVFVFAGAHRVDRFVLDLRDNGGGDNGLIRPIVVGLVQSRSIDVRGRLFVLIGHGTASAAQSLVDRLESYTNAVFVGEPTGQNPNFYANSHMIDLPYSHLSIPMAALFWQDAGPYDTRTSTGPEIAVPVSFADYRNNVDPVMNEIVSGRAVPLEDAVTAALAAGYPATLDACRAWLTDSRHRFAVPSETRLLALGGTLLKRHRLDDAINVLRANSDINPGSARAFAELGRAYALASRKAEAIGAYETAIKLNPGDYSSMGAIRKLKSS